MVGFDPSHWQIGSERCESLSGVRSARVRAVCHEVLGLRDIGVKGIIYPQLLP